MLSDKKQKTIDLIIEGKTSKTDIGTLVGVSRQMIYEYLKDPEVQAELNARLSEIRNQSVKTFTAKLEPVIDELYRIALTGSDIRSRNNACQYIINRVLGTPRATLEMDDKREDDSDIDVLAAFDAVVNAEKE